MAQNKQSYDLNEVLETRSRIDKDLRDQVEMCSSFLKSYSSPLVITSKMRLKNNARRFMKAMPSVTPHYAVKANPDKEILKILMQEGVNFEIASVAELNLLMDLKVDPKSILFSNPIKSPKALKESLSYGVQWFAADTPEEVIKIAEIDDSARIFLRIAVSNEGSMWPLCEKFGSEMDAVQTLITAAKDNSVSIEGVSFHVGSQCSNVKNWLDGIERAVDIFSLLETAGMMPTLLNIGGGFPIQMSEKDPSIEEIGLNINEALKALPSSIKVVAEPGRYLIGSAGCLVTQIIGIATRKDSRWIYLDSGLYGGLMEMAESFPTKIISERTDELSDWTLAGPTCDSIDVLGKHKLPKSSQIDDLVFIPNLGAYCTTCGTDFNGFPPPKLVLVK